MTEIPLLYSPETIGRFIDPPKQDVVYHPQHYTPDKIEVIDAIEAWELGFHLGNVVKYVVRAGRKDPSRLKQDLQKAAWYLQRYIDQLDDKG